MKPIPLNKRHPIFTQTGSKAGLLAKASRTGLPVPRGVLIPHEMYADALEARLIQYEHKELFCPNPAQLIARLNLPTLVGPVAVRSAFSAEDHVDRSLAGFFTTRLRVDPTRPALLVHELCEVWASAARHGGDNLRRDVLIMRMVAAERAGVAFTERVYEDDLINWTRGTGDALVSGLVAGESDLLPRLWRWEARSPGAWQPWQVRLQRLLRDVRRVFGRADWDVEWADDGSVCWLLQVRPVTRPTVRNEVFTIANHKEILPDLPSILMTDVIETCAPDLFAYYRRFDRTLPDKRPFIEVFNGRPFINLSLLTEMMRIFGLPTRLVTDNIGGGDVQQPVGVNLGRMAVKIASLTLPRFALAQLKSVGSAERAWKRLRARSDRPGSTFAELIETARWMYTTLVTEMFSLTAAIGPMTLLLRRFGTLEAHNARQQTIGARMLADLAPLRAYAAEHPAVRAALEDGKLPDDPTFNTLWVAWLERYGHRGIYESDLARPRYAEAPETLFSVIAAPPTHAPKPPALGWKGYLTLPLGWQAGRTMRARELWRHRAMIGFARVRAAILQRAQLLADAGRLPHAAAIWDLQIGELMALDDGWEPHADFWSARQAEIDRLRALRTPDLFRRFDDLAALANTPTPSDGRWRGVPLTRGTVEGAAWVLDEPATRLPPGFDPAHTIVIARAVDAGWIGTFALAAGVAVETGGDLSHGSIILREIGLPAITNAHGILRGLQTGDRVRLDAAAGTLERG